MKFFNANAVHNVINVMLLLIPVLVGFDWTAFGIDAERALLITGALSLLKLIINALRDGVAGMVKEQPPVKS